MLSIKPQTVKARDVTATFIDGKDGLSVVEVLYPGGRLHLWFGVNGEVYRVKQTPWTPEGVLPADV